MTNYRKIFANVAVAGVLGGVISTTSMPLIANAQESTSSSSELEKIDTGGNFKPAYLSEELTQEDKEFMNKLETIYSELELDSNNHLVLQITDIELKQNYKFTDQDIQTLHDTLNFQKENANIEVSDQPAGNPDLVSPMLHVSDWKVYLTNDDLKMYLSSAIQAGAPAVVAVLAGLGTTVGTPGVGTVLGVALGLFGAGPITYQITQALANGQGWYIGVTWNGAFPNPDSGTW
ncbi:hypothetical protein [Marinilactibacillus kalidii]|uniref:hypothetical protein n=1 Tax=Marinilactibacillus kalidii TaxID=2820274 RepID=UPI001ABE671F|nr:hypothetical protein [Marinilactibacillus kalidii]